MSKQRRKVKSISKSIFESRNDFGCEKYCEKNVRFSFGYFESMAMTK